MLLTAEQAAVVECVRAGLDGIVEAVAGSGKSTTILACLQVLSRPATVLTYNKSLQVGFAKKVQTPHEVLTFHALAGRVFGYVIRDDSSLLHALDNDTPKGDLRIPNTIFIDEAQDMKAIFARLLALLVKPTTQICLLGDAEQLVNDFSRDFSALEDFTESPERYLRGRSFVRLTLSISFRLPPSVANVVNRLGGSGRIVGGGCADGEVVIATVDPDEYTSGLLHAIEDAAVEGDVFILAARKKRNRQLRQLANALVARGNSIGVHRVDSDTVVSNARIKVLSFHSSKGLEADTVFVLGVMATPRRSDARPLHVALSRSKKKLVVVQRSRMQRVDLAQVVVDSASGEMPDVRLMHLVPGSGEECPASEDDALVVASDAVERARNTVMENEFLALDMGVMRAEVEEVAVARMREAAELAPPRTRDVLSIEPTCSTDRIHTIFRFSEVGYDKQARVYVPTSSYDDDALLFGGVDLRSIVVKMVCMKVELYLTGACERCRFVADPTGERSGRIVPVDAQRKLPAGTRERDLLPPAAFALLARLPLPSRETGWTQIAQWAILSTIFNEWRADGLVRLLLSVGTFIREEALEELWRCAHQALPRTGAPIRMDKYVSYVLHDIETEDTPAPRMTDFFADLPFDIEMMARPCSTPQLLCSRVAAICESKGFAFVYGREALDDVAGLTKHLLPLLLYSDIETMRVVDVTSALSRVVRLTNSSVADVDEALRSITST